MTATLIVALIGTFGSVLLVVVTKLWERKAAIAQANRERKIPIYEGILKQAGPVMAALKEQKEIPSTPDLTQKVASWASNDVLVFYLRFRAECGNPKDYEGKNLIESFSDMVLAIRKDLGYKKPRRLTDELKNAIGASVLFDSQPSEISQQQDEQSTKDSSPVSN